MDFKQYTNPHISTEYTKTDVGPEMEYTSLAGESIPALGIGTYRMSGSECKRAVRSALDIGYRHIDTAIAYGNERQVGEAIEESDVDRDEVFITTKLKGYSEYLEGDGPITAVEDSLTRLGTDYIDLLLIHWWNPDIDTNEPISSMNHLQDQGKVRHIGVSNFSVEQLEASMAASDTPIVTNQVEYHPYREINELLEFCRSNSVTVTAYSPLCEGRVLSDDTLASIGSRYEKTPAQVALRWLVQQPGVAAIPKARSREHQRQNMKIFDFELSGQEVQRIEKLDGPLLYRLNSEGGLIYRMRGQAGPIYSAAKSFLS